VQLRRAILGKFRLDGVEVDAVVFKDVVGMVLAGQVRQVTEQVGYKVRELLKGRTVFPEGAREVLFGDDWEKDAVAYTLYADAISGRLTRDETAAALAGAGVQRAWVDEALGLLDGIPRADAVERIYIALARGGPLERFERFGTSVVPTFNAFQAALVLHHDGHVLRDGVADVARSLLAEFGYDPMRVRNSFEDVVLRGLLPVDAAREVAGPLVDRGLMTPPEIPEVVQPVAARPRETRAARPFDALMQRIRSLRER
jgi:hypothetical protein